MRLCESSLNINILPKDPYLEDQLARFVGVGPNLVVEEPHPFASSTNPLMTMISFLSSSVDPRGILISSGNTISISNAYLAI